MPELRMSMPFASLYTSVVFSKIFLLLVSLAGQQTVLSHIKGGSVFDGSMMSNVDMSS